MEAEDSPTEEREEKMVSSNGGNPTLRIGRFLRPCAERPEKAASLPLVPLLSETMAPNLTKWPSKVLFKGCRQPLKKWKLWVDRLAKLHEPTWKKAGIYDAIIGSTYEIHEDWELVLGLSEFWCSEMNIFLFPWGEVTVTLEDTLILGNLSLLGQPVTNPLVEEHLKKIEEKLIAEQMHLEGSNMANLSAWINRFMVSKANGDRELEHVAFLAYWLSTFWFASQPESVIEESVFPVAVHLSMGTRVALAPAVLANLYKDLRAIYEHVYVAKSAAFSVFSHFQLLHMWAWERFPLLRPHGSPCALNPGEPRVGRWKKCNSNSRFNLKLPLVRSVLKQIDDFEWRPYVSGVYNWRYPSFYKGREELLNKGCLLDDDDDDELQSFIRCLRSSELVGLDQIELYLPHRVSRQFGIDQDLPGHFPLSNSKGKDAWSSYDRHVRDPRLFIRCRYIETECTQRYSDWWKQSMLVRKEAIKELLEKRENLNKNFEVDLKAEASNMGYLEQEQSMEHLLEFTPEKPSFSPRKSGAIKVNRKAEAVKMGNQEDEQEQRVELPMECNPVKASGSKRKRRETERYSNWRMHIMFGESWSDEEQSNLSSYDEIPPGYPPNKANFWKGKKRRSRNPEAKIKEGKETEDLTLLCNDAEAAEYY